MRFRLTYEGPLLASTNGNTRASHKQEIRKHFHPQLRALWATHPYLRAGYPVREHPVGSYGPATNFILVAGKTMVEYVSERYTQLGYRFAPLVRPELALNC